MNNEHEIPPQPEDDKPDIWDSALDEAETRADTDPIRNTIYSLADRLRSDGQDVEVHSIESAIDYWEQLELNRQMEVSEEMGSNDHLKITYANGAIKYIDLVKESGWRLFLSTLSAYHNLGQEESLTHLTAWSHGMERTGYRINRQFARLNPVGYYSDAEPLEPIVSCERGNILDFNPGVVDVRDYFSDEDPELNVALLAQALLPAVRYAASPHAFAEDSEPYNQTLANVERLFGHETRMQVWDEIMRRYKSEEE